MNSVSDSYNEVFHNLISNITGTELVVVLLIFSAIIIKWFRIGESFSKSQIEQDKLFGFTAAEDSDFSTWAGTLITPRGFGVLSRKFNFQTTEYQGIKLGRYLCSEGRRVRTDIIVVELNQILPTFNLSPRWRRDKFNDANIHFDNQETFSKKHFLIADDEKKIRQLFTPKILSFLSQKTDLEIQSTGNRLFIVNGEGFYWEGEPKERYFEPLVDIVKMFQAANPN